MSRGSESKLRFNCYLLRDGLSAPELALRPKYRPGGPGSMIRLPTASSAPSDAIAYIGSSEPKTPRWASLLDQFFPGAAQASSQANRMVVFLPVGLRWFAICFGYGSGALDWESIETTFGLRVAARLIRPDKVTEIRSRRIDATARTQSVSVVVGSDLRDLDINLDGEFVRRLVGQLDDGGLADATGAIIASDSIAFRAETDLGLVREILGTMLNDLETTEVNESFAFVDSLEPLRKSQLIVKQLDNMVAAAVLQADVPLGKDVVELESHFLEFAPPDEVQLDDVESFRAVSGQRESTFHDPSLSGLRVALTELGVKRGRSFLAAVKVIAIGPDGGERSQALPLANWLVFEAGNAVSRYVLTLGRWFRLKESYSDKLNRDLLRIDDITMQLGLPDWDSSKEEKEYNALAAATDPRLLNLDRCLIRASDGGRIESCDLLHQDGYLIHVKRYNGSQTLSHLFAQGTVSAGLLNGDAAFKQNFVSETQARDPSFGGVASDAPVSVTYAIGVAGSRSLPTDLPTFSKVNLRDHAQRLRNARVRPTLARIPIV